MKSNHVVIMIVGLSNTIALECLLFIVVTLELNTVLIVIKYIVK